MYSFPNLEPVCYSMSSSSFFFFFSCPVLTVASWPAYRFLRRQVRWSGMPISFRIFQFVVIYTVKGFDIVNKAEVDAFLELSCFFNDPMDADNLISGSSAFSKSSLNIWKFLVQVLLKPGLENFEHYFTSVWDKCSCAVVWVFFGIAFFWGQWEGVSGGRGHTYTYGLFMLIFGRKQHNSVKQLSFN